MTLNGQSDFWLGCNYWASHAAVFMWRDWDADVVEADFRRLSASGLRVLRVFPLWSDFQPIHLLRGWAGTPVEVRFGEEPLPDTPAGRAGLDETMLVRFETLTRLSRQYGIRLIVSLLTGWMSGRLFVPPALEGRRLFTDPFALRWEVRFVTGFVGRFQDDEAIAAWEFGNECNCLDEAAGSDEAFVWQHTIASTIRAADRWPRRPVLSGMHSQRRAGVWRIADQGEIADGLTTHPYPIFTPGCDLDPLDSLRPILHSTAESLYYSGLSHKPCLVEEIGSISGTLNGEERSAAFARVALFSTWAHGLDGFLWWCAFDQDRIPNAPYDWTLLEQELGLFASDGRGKPVLAAMRRFAQFLETFPGPLPERRIDGVCLLTRGQDDWGVGFNTFVLAKQAGVELIFQDADEPLRDAPFYLLPSIKGSEALRSSRYRELMEKVQAGATLYLSLDEGYLGHVESYFGFRLCGQHTAPGVETVTVSLDGGFALPLWHSRVYALEPAGCEVLAGGEDGRPVLIRHAYGRGQVYLLTCPLERQLAEQPEAYAPAAAPYYRLYRGIAPPVDRACRAGDPFLLCTEHARADGGRIVVCLNGGAAPAAATLGEGWRIGEVYYGDPAAVPACDAAVFEVSRGEV